MKRVRANHDKYRDTIICDNIYDIVGQYAKGNKPHTRKNTI